MKILIEENVPFMRGVLEPYAKVTYLPSDAIDRDAVADMDAIVVRTRTRCDADLLSGSRVKFVGTATIGLDHIDRDWCAANGIVAVNAPGCNAPAVAQYVFSSILRVVNRPLHKHTLGIVGVGNIGRLVERWARSIEMPVMLCDPPRQKAEGGDGWSSLEEIAENADIVTFHTPLTRSGEDATYHLAGSEFFGSLRRAPIFVNASRGPVVDTEALIEAIDKGLVGKTVIDVWEGEPSISLELLKRAAIATPHIAGYSEDGKIRASQMVLDSLCDTLGLPRLTAAAPRKAAAVPASITPVEALRGYDPLLDDAALRARPDSLEALRDGYSLRPELLEAIMR